MINVIFYRRTIYYVGKLNILSFVFMFYMIKLILVVIFMILMANKRLTNVINNIPPLYVSMLFPFAVTLSIANLFFKHYGHEL